MLRRGLNIIGEQWYLGNVSVQQEHFASSQAIRRIEALICAAPQPTRQQTVLVGCPVGELHTFPAIMLSLFLQRKGLKVVYLGADTPIEHMDQAIEAVHPNLVVFTAQHLVSAASLSEAAMLLQEHHIPLAYGGLIFNRVPELRQRISGTFLGENIEAATNKIEQLILSPEFPSPIQLDEKYRELAQSFRFSRSSVEKELYALLQKDGVLIETIGNVSIFFANDLAAALDLGDPAFLESELNWIDGLLNSHHRTAEQLLFYLSAYSHSVNAVLGEDGKPITEWIDSYLARQ